MIFWESNERHSIAARVAVAGDFLPAGRLNLKTPLADPRELWRKMANHLAQLFDDVSVSFVNCEATLDTANLAPRRLGGLGDVVSARPECLDYLEAIRANVVGVANNHSYDFGAAGVERTRRAIEQRGMIPLGAGRNLQSAPEVLVWQGPGRIRVGFWAAARATTDASTPKSAGVEPATPDRALQALGLMKEQGAGFCVALLHAGCLRTNYPDPEDVDLMDSLAHAGFDLVTASHSHRISGARIIRKQGNRSAFCCYGLGSIVSGYVASHAEREGLVIVACFDANGALARIEVRPVLLADSGFGETLSCEASEAVLLRFRVLSDEIATGSYARLFYSDVSRGLLRLYARDARRAFREDGLRGLARKAQRIRMRHVRRLVYKVLG